MGAKDSLEQNVIVKASPKIGFTAPVVCQGLPTTFTNATLTNGLTITGWDWNFGDGQISTTQQPSTHGYINAGDYLVNLKAISSNGCADSITKTVNVANYPIAAVTGIEDIDPFAGQKIYPNPTPGMFTVEMNNNVMGELDIRIINQAGKEILNIKFDKTTVHFQSQIDLSGQGDVIYFIEFLFDEEQVVKKVVVE